MNDSETLASLTTKDLRQLAGEHQIQNRSRLGREELIQALQQAISDRSGATPENPTPSAQPDPAAAPAAAVAVPAPEPAPAAAVQEPEVLDASLVAEVTGAADAADADADQGDEEDGGPEDGEPSDQPQQPGQFGESGEPGRRRRRRRRRGRGRGRDGQPQDGHPQGNGQPPRPHDGQGRDGQPPARNDQPRHEPQPRQQSEAPAQPQQQTIDLGPAAVEQLAATPAPAVEAAPAAVPATPAQPASQPRRDDRQRDDRREDRQRDDRREDRQRDDRRERDDRRQGEQRPPRPRIDGPIRGIPSVLDRLCTFSKGLLELCDPSTPSWAQPRIAELLAEAGVVPTPSTGAPHPDFHQIVGTLATAAVPAGHIAEVTAPGFALRGDRGDLFALRKAQVRIAANGERKLAEPAPAPAPVPAAEPAAAPVAPVMPPVLVPVQTAEAPAAAESPSGDPEDDTPTEALTPPQPRPEPPPPAPGRTPHKTHVREPADAAPALPLAPQVPDELAARAKADGFRSLGLNDQILADLAATGWNAPSPIQAEAIPHVLALKDVLGQAQTGTGKTGAFVLPMLQRLYSLERPRGSSPVALVLAPTRELARQVHSEFLRMAGASGARAALIYGGVPMEEQYRALDRSPHVVVGTPGRVIDHMKRRTLDLSKLDMLVLDEADQMLDIGFWPDIQYVVSHTPPSRQMLLFSATFPEPILELIRRHMKEPVHVRIAPKQVTVEQVDQKFIAVGRERKNSLLAHFIESQNPPQMVVFCKTKHQTDRVAEVLKRKNMSAEAIHGDLPQSRRERTLTRFRDGSLQCLIATNVAARGLDIPSVSHVVNYDIPETPEEYVHRIGRTARNGARGVARTFITPDDGQFLLEIEKHIGLLLEEEVIEGFSDDPAAKEGPKRILAETEPGTTRLLKPLTGGIRLGRRR